MRYKNTAHRPIHLLNRVRTITMTYKAEYTECTIGLIVDGAL